MGYVQQQAEVVAARGPWLQRPSGLMAPGGGGAAGAGGWLEVDGVVDGLAVPAEIRGELYFLTKEKVR